VNPSRAPGAVGCTQIRKVRTGNLSHYDQHLSTYSN